MTHDEATNNDTMKRRGVILYKSNPFIQDATIRAKTKRIANKKGDMMLVSSSTGEIQAPIAGFWTAEEVDNAKFIKIFVDGVKALAELTNSGTRVFELLYIEMQRNIGKDTVYLSYTGLDQNKISRSTFARGLSELIEKKFIAAQPAIGWYWVNPDFIWNGDRLAFIREVRKQSPNVDPRQQALPLEDIISIPDSQELE